MKLLSAVLLTLPALTHAHLAAWTNGMFCLNGNEANPNSNTNTVVSPLYNLAKSSWWFQADRNCPSYPPASGKFLDLPANGQFTVEIANNQAFTSYSYGGSQTSVWPDGKSHPEDWHGDPAYDSYTPKEGCIMDAQPGGGGYMHTQNQSMAQGTAFAISYVSSIAEVTMENLVVFSVRHNTPWKRQQTYAVPNLPACPSGGCICAWLWVPKGCGQQNMYMQGHKCRVTGATSTRKLATAKPPVYCEGNSNGCVKGAKQMIAAYQQSGNNIGTGTSNGVPNGKVPTYNANCGFANGAQTDIFA